LVTTSDGVKITNPKHFNNKYRKLRAAQKTLARRQKGSKNREKARIAVARIQAKIADSRQDFLHKLTTQLVRENQVIAVEDLAVRNLVKNRSLARSISDAGWGELVRQLEYKCQWYGRELVKIDRFFPSSKRCGNCGFVIEQLSLSVREWTCPECGTSHDRDINAANNILAAGLAVTVCGVLTSSYVVPIPHPFVEMLHMPLLYLSRKQILGISFFTSESCTGDWPIASTPDS
jgi:putative transposase